MFGDDGRRNPKISVTRNGNERRIAERMRDIGMTANYRVRISVDSVEMSILIGAYSK